MKLTLIKFIYGMVKAYVLKEVKATGNEELIKKCETALKVIEDAFVTITKKK